MDQLAMLKQFRHISGSHHPHPNMNEHKRQRCRQAMVCPHPQRPTGSGSDSEYSAPARTLLTESHEEYSRGEHVRLLALRSVDRMYSINVVRKLPWSSKTPQQFNQAIRVRMSGSLGTDLDGRRRRGRRRGRIFLDKCRRCGSSSGR